MSRWPAPSSSPHSPAVHVHDLPRHEPLDQQVCQSQHRGVVGSGTVYDWKMHEIQASGPLSRPECMGWNGLHQLDGVVDVGPQLGTCHNIPNTGV